jgi:PTS system nitrogen regulatory IIA component
MSLLCEALNPQRIVCQALLDNGLQVLERAAVLFEHENTLDSSSVLRCLQEREALGSTALGDGVAIPHGRLAGIKTAQLVVMTLKEAVSYDSPDGLLVNLFVVMLIPISSTQLHLKLLSQIANMLNEKVIRDHILNLSSPAALYDYFLQQPI